MNSNGFVIHQLSSFISHTYSGLHVVENAADSWARVYFAIIDRFQSRTFHIVLLSLIIERCKISD